MIESIVSEFNERTWKKALTYCITNSLFSAAEFRDAAQYFDKQFQEEQEALLQNPKVGPPGVEKTHLSISLGLAAIDTWYRVFFAPMEQLILWLKTKAISSRSKKQLMRLYKADLVILDEMGFQSISRKKQPCCLGSLTGFQGFHKRLCASQCDNVCAWTLVNFRCGRQGGDKAFTQ